MTKIALVILSLFVFGLTLKSKAFYDISRFEQSCPFCQKDILERQKIYEDDLITVLLSHKPILDGHCLIIPKRHVRTFLELSPEELFSVQAAVHLLHKQIGKEAFLLLQKNGIEVGQSVPHVHFHYIPREQGETSSFPVLFKFFISPLLPPLSAKEMEKRRKELTELVH